MINKTNVLNKLEQDIKSLNKAMDWHAARTKEILQENAELREALQESRSALSACSIQESSNDGTENRMKIKALDKLVASIDKLLNK